MNSWRACLLLVTSIPAIFLGTVLPSSGKQVRVTVTGEEEIVVSKKQLKCRTAPGSDSLDLPASAFRTADGEVLLIAGNRTNYVLRGPTLDKVRRTDCRNLLSSSSDPDPAKFNDQEWVTALFSLDGKNVTGFVHNEFHEELHGNKNCRIVLNYDRECWYASTKMIRSSDGGKSFVDDGRVGNILIGPARKYVSGERRLGTFLPKVVGGKDGKSVYVFVSRSDRERGIRIGQCLLRSVVGKKQWEIWDDEGFREYSSSPYFPSTLPRRSDHCKTVIPGNILSVKYNRELDLYLAVGGGPKGSVVVRHSHDLINWSKPSKIRGIDADPVADRENAHRGQFLNRRWYFSLLDPNSPSRNFDVIGNNPYLYFVEFGNGKNRNQRIRNLKRVRVKVSFK